MDLKKYLGKKIKIIIDRPLGSNHTKYDFVYEVNYGYVPETKAPDGEEIDAYLLGVDKAVDEYTGKCIAIVHRTNDDDDKLIIVSERANDLSNEEIIRQINFQEKYFISEIQR
jgi:inorganic pyrophosphatase